MHTCAGVHVYFGNVHVWHKNTLVKYTVLFIMEEVTFNVDNEQVDTVDPDFVF